MCPILLPVKRLLQGHKFVLKLCANLLGKQHKLLSNYIIYAIISISCIDFLKCTFLLCTYML